MFNYQQAGQVRIIAAPTKNNSHYMFSKKVWSEVITVQRWKKLDTLPTLRGF